MSLSPEKAKNLFDRIHGGYSVSEVRNAGKSWLSRDIICSALGHGSKNVMIVGGFGGKDAFISSFLTDFSHELDDSFSLKGRISDFNISALCSKNRIYIIPMLNPDGIIVNNLGIYPDNPFYGRVMGMMKDSTDFSKWDANIRGVSVYGNFKNDWIKLKLTERSKGIFMTSPCGYYGEYPESELETSSLCSFSRRINPEMVFELRRMENICIIPVGKESLKNKVNAVARIISEYTNIKVLTDDSYVNGSFASWTSEDLDCMSFIIGITDEMTPESCSALKNAILLAMAV